MALLRSLAPIIPAANIISPPIKCPNKIAAMAFPNPSGAKYVPVKISAMDTPAGKEIQLEAKNVLLKPVENMSLVVGHISDTLNLIIGSGYYKDVFTGFEELSHLF